MADPVTAAAGEAEQKKREYEGQEEKLEYKQKELVKVIQQGGAAKDESIQNAKEAEEQAAELDAENQAAQQVANGQVVGLMEAYALVEQEDEANRLAREAKTEALKTTVQYDVETVVQGVDVFMSSLDTVGKGLWDGLTDPEARKTALISTGVGAALGAFVQNEDIQNLVISGINQFTGCQNGVQSDVSEKFVGGVTTPEEQGAYAASTANGESKDPYNPDGDTEADEKDVPKPDGYEAPSGTNALDASDEELNRLADVDKVASGEATSDMGAWFDSVAQMFKVSEDGKEQSFATGLMESISEDGIKGTILKVAAQVGKTKLEQLHDMTSEIDANEAKKQEESQMTGDFPSKA